MRPGKVVFITVITVIAGTWLAHKNSTLNKVWP